MYYNLYYSHLKHKEDLKLNLDQVVEMRVWDLGSSDGSVAYLYDKAVEPIFYLSGKELREYTEIGRKLELKKNRGDLFSDAFPVESDEAILDLKNIESQSHFVFKYGVSSEDDD